MSKAQHTPGPWWADGWEVAAVADDMTVATCAVGNEQPTEGIEANARIMAKSPQLLERLEHLLGCCELNLDDMEPDTCRAIRGARELIEEVQRD